MLVVSVVLAYRSAEISLYKIGLSKSSFLSVFDSRDFDRIEYLYSCLQAVKSFFDAFLGMPIGKLHCLAMPIAGHLISSFGVLQLLTTFNHPDWNLEWAQATISFTDTLGRLAENYSKVKMTLGLDPHTPDGEDIFSHTGRRMLFVKSFFEGEDADGQSQREQHVPNVAATPNVPTGDGNVDFMDDVWMHDLLEPFELW